VQRDKKWARKSNTGFSGAGRARNPKKLQPDDCWPRNKGCERAHWGRCQTFEAAENAMYVNASGRWRPK
jgi:hypothetical protein